MTRKFQTYLDRITEVEIKNKLLDAVAKSYDAISKAASREISRRTAEMESNLGNDA